MKRNYVRLLFVIGLGVFFNLGAVMADPVGVDFSQGGNLPVEIKLTAGRYSPDGTATPGINLILPAEDATSSPRLFTLNDGGEILAGFGGTGYSTSAGRNFGGSISLADDGEFSLVFENGYLGEGVDYSTTFILTLQGLLPEDGSVLNGFNFVSGTEEYFPMLTFNFSNAASGVVVITGNIAANASITGYFTGTAPIPEPATMALLLAAAAGVAAGWKRRRKVV